MAPAEPPLVKPLTTRLQRQSRRSIQPAGIAAFTDKSFVILKGGSAGAIALPL